MNRSLQVSLWAVTALLAACGGGGGSAGSPAPQSSPTPSPAPAPGSYNVQAGWKNFLTGTPPNTWSVSGTSSNGKAYTIGLATAAAPGEVFSMTGNSYSVGDVTATVGISGLGIDVTKNRSYYDPASFGVVGTKSTFNTNPSTCSIATEVNVPPTSANVGSAGALNKFNDYNGCVQASAQQTGTAVSTWSLESDGGFALFCLNTTSSNMANQVTQVEGDCVEINPDGTLGTHARISVSEGGVTIVAKNY